ncbi:hypothetical protein [Klebsiella grimontii]|uniref:hypothetical protein n=1 Tax=Klebsiella grimontii TaxID=2058152 RepID=UPI001CCF60FB|nr:hypothetical protein [Klebsiella grimontii]MBZ7670111.1 hypothetical protein [Klebsiella grimontii]
MILPVNRTRGAKKINSRIDKSLLIKPTNQPTTTLNQPQKQHWTLTKSQNTRQKIPLNKYYIIIIMRNLPMSRTEFQIFEDDSFYFLYVTDKIRIETDGSHGLILEYRGSFKQELIDINYYLDLPNDEAAYLQQSLVNTELDIVIKAVNVLHNNLNLEFLSYPL